MIAINAEQKWASIHFLQKSEEKFKLPNFSWNWLDVKSIAEMLFKKCCTEISMWKGLYILKINISFA